MTIPDGAIFEADLGDGVALYDVSHLLPKNPRKRQRKRDVAGIVRVYVHKSGGIGKPGYEGLLGSTRYVVQRRGFPCSAYTFWASRVPDVDAEGRLVLYRANLDDTRSWHTGRQCNDHGVALSLQGNPSKHPLTAKQKRLAAAGLAYCTARYSLSDDTPIGTHSDSKRFGSGKSKKTCPGIRAEQWLKDYLR